MFWGFSPFLKENLRLAFIRIIRQLTDLDLMLVAVPHSHCSILLLTTIEQVLSFVLKVIWHSFCFNNSCFCNWFPWFLRWCRGNGGGLKLFTHLEVMFYHWKLYQVIWYCQVLVLLQTLQLNTTWSSQRRARSIPIIMCRPIEHVSFFFFHDFE